MGKIENKTVFYFNFVKKHLFLKSKVSTVVLITLFIIKPLTCENFLFRGRSLMETNVSLTFELFFLMNWLLKHEKALLNSLIKHAIDHGFAQDLEKMDMNQYLQSADQFYAVILEFLLFLEKSLIQNLESVQLDQAAKDEIFPALKKIDLEALDLKTISRSLQQTKTKLSQGQLKKINEASTTQEQANTLLFEQLLKNWKPTKKEPLN